MASAKSYMIASSRRATKANNNYRFLATDPIQTPSPSSDFEFDESDLWTGSTRSDSPDSRSSWRSKSSRRLMAAPTPAKSRYGGDAPSSLPVNIPDWSKILRGEYNKAEQWSFNGGGDSGDDDGEEWVPPHEYLARTRVASFSVHEGIGRTLKGRDLSKVRNAIWEKTGFED